MYAFGLPPPPTCDAYIKPSCQPLPNSIIIIIIIIISFFQVDFYITFYNYNKPINVNLPRKLEKNSDAKRFANSLI